MMISMIDLNITINIRISRDNIDIYDYITLRVKIFGTTYSLLLMFLIIFSLKYQVLPLNVQLWVNVQHQG